LETPAAEKTSTAKEMEATAETQYENTSSRLDLATVGRQQQQNANKCRDHNNIWRSRNSDGNNNIGNGRISSNRKGNRNVKGPKQHQPGTLATSGMLGAVGTPATTALQATLPIRRCQVSSSFINLLYCKK
jgi:hypothetical protein